MAIKTKKISELASLDLGGTAVEVITSGGVNLLGTTTGGVTGKLSTKTLYDAIKSEVLEACRQEISANENARNTPALMSLRSEDLTSVNESIATLTSKLQTTNKALNDLSLKYKNYTFNTAKRINSISETLEESVEKLAKLEQFIKDLQKDGYLTLAEIKKAASVCFPVSTTETTEESAE